MAPNDASSREAADAASTQFAYECALCGVASDNPDAYRLVQTRRRPFFSRSFGKRQTQRQCQPCAGLEAIREDTANTRWIAALTVVSLAVAWLAPGSTYARFAWTFINFASVAILLVLPTIVVHELGHWAMARILGLGVHAVEIGVGPSRWSGRWGDVRIQWRRHALLGRLHLSAPSRSFARTRFFFTTAAGPATHLLWIMGAFAITGGFDLSGPGPLGLGAAHDRLNPLVAVVWLNALSLAVNLFPARIGEITTDGALLLAIPFLTPEQVDELVVSQWATPVSMALADGEWERAKEDLDAGLRYAPDSPVLNLLHAAYLATVGEPERAVQLLRAEHAREDQDPNLRAALASSLAWCLCVIGDPDDLEECEALVGEAQRQLGEQPAVLSTRAAVLLAAGRAREARPLLSNALSKIDEIDYRASILCNLARAEYRLGLSDSARERLAEARSLSPRNALIEQTERELAEAPRPEAPSPLTFEDPPRASALAVAASDPPRPARARQRVWLGVAVPSALLLWSCGPPFVESALTMNVPYHDLARGPASEQERVACEAGLATLEQWGWLISRLPNRNAHWARWQASRVAHLHACAGDLEQAHAMLVRLTSETIAAIGSGGLAFPLSQGASEFRAEDSADGPNRYAAALAAFEFHLALIHLEERLGHGASAEDTLDRAHALATQIDLAWPDDPQFGTRSRVARLAAERVERRAGPEAALAQIEETLHTIGAEFADVHLVALLTLQAELLERVGRVDEANSVWARIGRARHETFALHEGET